MRLPKVVALSLGVSSGVSTASAQGVLANLANSLGATIYPLFFGDTVFKGPDYRVEVFVYDPGKPGGFGAQLGSTGSLLDNGRFNAGSNIVVPNANAGDTVDLVVRSWNAVQPGGASWDTAAQHYVTSPFTTGILGGNPPGGGNLPPLVPGKFVTGLPGGFTGALSFPVPTPIGVFANLANSVGSRVYPVFAQDGVTPLMGDHFKVQVFRYDETAPGGFGSQLGSTVSPGDVGRFNAGSNVLVPGVSPRDTTQLIVRAWDATTGSSYETATARGTSLNFVSTPLGGDIDGDGPILPIPGTGMVSGLPAGFQSFRINSPTYDPSVGLIGRLDNRAFDGSLVPIFNVDGVTKLAGGGFKVEVFVFDANRPGGFGTKLGATMSPDQDGHFGSGQLAQVPGTVAGQTATLVVRAWDLASGDTFDVAKVKGVSDSFTSSILGGDPDGSGPLKVINPIGMTTGTSSGFTSFSLSLPPSAPDVGLIAALSNVAGERVVPIFGTDGTTVLTGARYKVEVFTYDGLKIGGFDRKLGVTSSPNDSGVFDSGANITVPGKVAAEVGTLIVRAWDTTTGLSYDSATIRGASTPFQTATLGGDPDGTGPLKRIEPKGMTTGSATGFQSFSLYAPPGPGTIPILANSVGGNVVLVFDADGATPLTGARFKVEVFTYDGLKAGGFGTQLGGVGTFDESGRFVAGSNIPVSGTLAGQTATLIVRAWDSAAGLSYDSATKRGASQPFQSGILGGDPDGSGPKPPINGESMATGRSDGFKSFSLAQNVTPPPPGSGGLIATLSNNLGSTVFPLYYADGSPIVQADPDIKVEVFLYDEGVRGGYWIQLGGVGTVGAKGRFNAGANAVTAKGGPGGRALLIVRAWDSTTGATYESSTVKGNSGPFYSDVLGGDPDGDGPLLPITGKTLASGLADGFKGFVIGYSATAVPEPSAFALGVFGAGAMLSFTGRRRGEPANRS